MVWQRKFSAGKLDQEIRRRPVDSMQYDDKNPTDERYEDDSHKESDAIPETDNIPDLDLFMKTKVLIHNTGTICKQGQLLVGLIIGMGM